MLSYRDKVKTLKTLPLVVRDELYGMASNIDTTQEQLISDAQLHAKRMTAFAEAIAKGETPDSPLTRDYSLCNDIVNATAKLKALKESFGVALRIANASA